MRIERKREIEMRKEREKDEDRKKKERGREGRIDREYFLLKEDHMKRVEKVFH